MKKFLIVVFGVLSALCTEATVCYGSARCGYHGVYGTLKTYQAGVDGMYALYEHSQSDAPGGMHEFLVGPCS